MIAKEGPSKTPGAVGKTSQTFEPQKGWLKFTAILSDLSVRPFREKLIDKPPSYPHPARQSIPAYNGRRAEILRPSLFNKPARLLPPYCF
jgi:hypothetical protein